MKRYLIQQRHWLFSAVIALVFLTGFTGLYSEFLLDEADNDIEAESVEPDARKEGALPVYIAYNIKAQSLPNIKNAIKISWNVNPLYKGDFILGRAGEVIDTQERAMTAKSLRVVRARDTLSVIDSGLKPGRYYYVVLASEKVKSGDIELYRDVNYTSFPIMIDPPKPARTQEQVSMIFARNIGDQKVLVTWNLISAGDVSYAVYRSGASIDTKQRLREAKKIATVKNEQQYIDDTIDSPGVYYFAVTAIDADGKENTLLIPDQNYTSFGIRVARKRNITVGNLKAVKVEGTVRLEWDAPAKLSGREIRAYEIYRLDRPIERAESLGMAEMIATVNPSENRYIDSELTEKKNFYAVLVKFTDNTVDVSLKKGENYTAYPVSPGNLYQVTSVKASLKGRSVVITWNYSGNRGVRYFRLFKTRKKPERLRDIDERDIVEEVDIKKRSHRINREVEEGVFFGIAPFPDNENRDMKIIAGVNIIRHPLSAGTDKHRVRRHSTVVKGSTDAVDDVLKRTFFRGRYKQSLKELQNIVKTSDKENEIAKAKLFIGRTYIEMNDYSRALEYLVLKDVQKYYPRDALFWREFAVLRVR